MQTLLSVVLVSAFVAHEVMAWGTPGEEQAEYLKIDLWLKDKLGNGAAAHDYMKAAVEHYDSDKENFDFHKESAWKKFTSLDKLKGLWHGCDDATVYLLKTNIELASIDRKAPQNVVGPLQNVVYAYVVEHAKHCEPVYVRRLTDASKRGSSLLAKAHPTWPDFFKNEARLFGDLVEYGGTFRPDTPSEDALKLKLRGDDVEKFVEIVASAIKADPEARREGVYPHYKQGEAFTERDTLRLTKRMWVLKEKCSSYQEVYEEDIVPVFFDAGTQTGYKVYGSDKISDIMLNYYICWALRRHELPYVTLSNRTSYNILQPVAERVLRQAPEVDS